jgi:hypothetical protein
MSGIASCPACDSKNCSLFYEVHGVPAHNSLVFDTPQEARDFPKGDLKIAFCERCGFVFNTAFDPSLLAYSPAYEDQQSFSETFNQFARKLATDLIERHGLQGKNIVEIGCGKGDFLASLCTLADNRGIGIDPTAIHERLQGDAADRVTFLREFYSERHAELDFDFLCCRHTLEHIPDVGDFMRTVRASVEGKNPGIFFELPDVTRVLEDVAYWDMYYEHCSYFDPGSLARLFRYCDFDVLDLQRAYDDQYLVLNARPRRRSNEPLPIEGSVDQTRRAVKQFARSVAIITDGWRRYFENASRKKRVAIWGSGSKCVAFLTTLGIGLGDNVVIVDINPHRHGKFIPGTGMEISSPKILRDFMPHEVIVMNEIYTAEIGAELDKMGVETQLMTADGTMKATA